jgi:hypothetical protein
MIVPTFWAEGRIQDRVNGRQVTVRRFGWSDESQEDAQANADQRAREALASIAAGQTAPRRDLKRAYNGSVGVPIREEIVDRHGETVLTRNSYGALCLNTPNVLFADIDFDDSPSARLVWSVIIPLFACATFAGWMRHSWIVGLAAALIALGLGYPVATWLQRIFIRFAGGAEQLAKSRIEKFLSAHPDWHLRLYRTPAGLRVLAMHATFDPNDPLVAECFQTLGTDPIYARMCQRQHCFRARVSPKPWRIGISRHMKPSPGVWPINPDRHPDRYRWIEAYERVAQQYAACRFVEALGSGTIHPAAADVQRIHDELCQASRALTIA